jgi:ribosomal protein S27E
MSDCGHCWHVQSVLTCAPPKYAIKCCQCQERRTVNQRDLAGVTCQYGHVSRATLLTPDAGKAKDSSGDSFQ